MVTSRKKQIETIKSSIAKWEDMLTVAQFDNNTIAIKSITKVLVRLKSLLSESLSKYK